MTKTKTRELLDVFAALLAAAVLAACSSTNPTNHTGAGPTAPSGATIIPGGPLEPTPIAPSPKIPKSEQEAQDSALRYLQKTVDGLPPGTVLDMSDTIGGSNLGCDDNYTGPGPGPTEFSLFANVIGPAGVKPADLIAHAGELWRSWGITVMERDGFEKPNQFGYVPDGYHIQIKAAYPPDYPPTIVATSPCFPGALRQDGLPVPKVIRQSPPTQSSPPLR